MEDGLNNLEHLIAATNNIQEFAEEYFKYLYKLMNEIHTSTISAFVKELENARKKDNTVFIVGNGGSASTALHMASDLSIGAFPSDGLPLRVFALTDNIASMTAIANDFGYEALFVKQLKSYYKPGDKLIAISASGNSPNVVDAAQWVKNQGGTVMGLIGFDGGKLKSLCNLAIHVKTPIGEYGPVEDIHVIMDHLIFTWLSHIEQRKENK
jgi:D-sedoheptulose 7-phosphate isomerase